MTDKAEKKECFFIAPIGDPGSEIRKQSDDVLEFIVQPAADECGFECLRADDIDKPGLITTQVIQHIIEAPLVVADLTSHNPNVMYELAIRHASNKPVVQIIHAKDKIPFDVGQVRTVTYDLDARSAAEAKKKIAGQIRAVLKDPSDVDTPVSTALAQQITLKSGNPLERATGRIFELLQSLQQDVSGIDKQTRTNWDVLMGIIRPGFRAVPIDSIGGFGITGSSTALPIALVRPPAPSFGLRGSQGASASEVEGPRRVSPPDDPGGT